jgi:ankyrin repeat protein
MDETQRERILAQIEEIAKRHGKADDETLGELLARAAASGDEEAIKLLEEIGDIRM